MSKKKLSYWCKRCGETENVRCAECLKELHRRQDIAVPFAPPEYVKGKPPDNLGSKIGEED